MESKHVEAFIVLAEELHFGQAAKKLGTTQPILSQLIKAFETDLGSELFIRTTRSVALSPVGQALLGPAREFKEKANELRRVANDARQGRIGRVKLGFAGGAGYDLAFQLARLTAREANNVIIDINPQIFSSQAIEQIRNDNLDLAVITATEIPEDIEAFLLRRDRIYLAVSDLHPLADKESVKVEDLRDERMVAFPASSKSFLRELLLRLCREAGFEPNIVQDVQDPYSMVTVVGANVGLALIGESAQHLQSEGVRYLPFEDIDDELLLYVIWKRDQLSASLRLVLELVAEHLDVKMPESVYDAQIV